MQPWARRKQIINTLVAPSCPRVCINGKKAGPTVYVMLAVLESRMTPLERLHCMPLQGEQSLSQAGA